MSNATFTEEEWKALDLGLKFAPEKALNKFDTYINFWESMYGSF